MAITSLNKSDDGAAAAGCRTREGRAKQAGKALIMASLMMLPALAFAQDSGSGNQFFCYVAMYFKSIVGGACLVVIMLWAIEHVFGVAKLHDVVIKVGVAAAIVVGGAAMIKGSGLVSPSCTATGGGNTTISA
jgi:hypothetical protein